MRLVLPLLLAGCAIAACGGGDDPQDVEQAIRGWAKAANQHDAKAFCNDYVTEGFAERVSGATGGSARDQCEKLLRATRPGLKITILDVTKVKIDGDNATALVRRQTTGAAAGDQLFKLKKEDGDFRIASSGGE